MYKCSYMMYLVSLTNIVSLGNIYISIGLLTNNFRHA